MLVDLGRSENRQTICKQNGHEYLSVMKKKKKIFCGTTWFICLFYEDT